MTHLRHHLTRRRATWAAGSPGASRVFRVTTRALLVAGAGIACALIVSACGSSSASSAPATSSTTTSTTTTGTTTGTTNPAASLTAFRNCLQQQGVTLPQGGRAGGGVVGGGGAGGGTGAPGGGAGAPGGGRPALTAAQQKAFSACASLRPAGGFGGRGAGTGAGAGAGGATASAAFTKFQSCLKQHGVQTGSTGQTSAKTQAAIASCRTLLPNGGANAPSAGSGTTNTG